MQHTQQLFLEALKAALKNEQVEWNNKLERRNGWTCSAWRKCTRSFR